MTAEQALADPERVLAWLLSAAGTAHPTAPAAGLIPPTPPTPAEAAEQAEEGSCEGAAAPSRCPGLMEEARPPAREAASSDAPPPKRTRYTETCWGDFVSGGALGCEALPPQASRAAFRERRAAGRSSQQAELQQLAADARRAAAEAGLTLLRSHCSLSGYRGVLRDSDSTVGLKNPYRAQARPRLRPCLDPCLAQRFLPSVAGATRRAAGHARPVRHRGGGGALLRPLPRGRGGGQARL